MQISPYISLSISLVHMPARNLYCTLHPRFWRDIIYPRTMNLCRESVQIRSLKICHILPKYFILWRVLGRGLWCFKCNSFLQISPKTLYISHPDPFSQHPSCRGGSTWGGPHLQHEVTPTPATLHNDMWAQQSSGPTCHRDQFLLCATCTRTLLV